VEEHQSGKRDHSHKLWALLTFEMWHRIFIDQEITVLSGAGRDKARFVSI
jgi:hypothetical protein